MWCKKCNRGTVKDFCEFCGSSTESDAPHEIFWCAICNVPLIKSAKDIDRMICSLCGKVTTYLCADLRPVFPEERLFYEIIHGNPLAHINDSVWASDNRYYINGNSKPVTNAFYKKVSPKEIQAQLEKYNGQNGYEQFNAIIERFIRANENRLVEIVDEAHEFIVDSAKGYKKKDIVISFSGGKDSTIIADLVVRALRDPCLVHVYGDTTLEFPMTYEYAARFRNDNPRAIFKVARNNEQDFYLVCNDIGPPARMLRWCCFMFKTGPIARVLNRLYGEKDILTFYGIRKCESVSRSRYNRIENDAESIKIQKQKVASPIFFWKDIDVWLYILGDKKAAYAALKPKANS